MAPADPRGMPSGDRSRMEKNIANQEEKKLSNKYYPNLRSTQVRRAYLVASTVIPDQTLEHLLTQHHVFRRLVLRHAVSRRHLVMVVVRVGRQDVRWWRR